METGEVTPISFGGGPLWRCQCPRCGGTAEAINQVVVSDGDLEVVGFADTQEQVARIAASIDELRRLRANASVDEVIDVLEGQGEALRPVVEYIRAHHLELASLGVGITALVIALLAWLVPQPSNDQPQTPPGITQDQMERLIDDFERSATAGESGEDEPENAKSQGAASKRDVDLPHQKPNTR